MATNQEKIEALKAAMETIKELSPSLTPRAYNMKVRANNAYPVLESMIEELQDEELKK